MEEALVAELLTLELSGGLRRNGYAAHGNELRWISAAAGETVIDQGEPAAEAFVVLRGQLEVAYRDAHGSERLVSSLRGG